MKNWLVRSGTTAKTARNRLSFLRSAIDEAVTDGLLASNPVSLVTVSRYLDGSSVPERGARTWILHPGGGVRHHLHGPRHQ